MTGYTFDEQILSDLFKEVYGFRPREGFYQEWHAADMDGKQEIWDDLCQTHKLNMEFEREQEIEAINNFEIRVDELVDLGAPNRLTAIRWIVDGLELTENDLWYGADYICHCLGLPYRLNTLFTEAVEELRKQKEV